MDISLGGRCSKTSYDAVGNPPCVFLKIFQESHFSVIPSDADATFMSLYNIYKEYSWVATFNTQLYRK